MQKNQTRNNFYSNVITLAANAIVGLIYTPFLVRELGLVAYGIVPLSLLINQYITVITGALTSSFTRFYSVAIQKGEYTKASKEISTATIVILLIILSLLPFAIILITNIDVIFNISPQYIISARNLFLYTFISFFLSLFTSILNVTLYAQNRLDLMNLMKIVRNLFKLGLVVCFFEFINTDITYIGLANFVTELLILVLSIVLFIKINPAKIRIKVSYLDKKSLAAIGGMASWVIIHQIGDAGIYRIDNLIVNNYWGLASSGALGVVTELGSYLSIMVSLVSSLFGPLIIIAYAKNNHEEVQSLALNQSYIVGMIMAILTGVVAGFSLIILRLWINSDFQQYHWWLVVKLVSLPFYAAGGVLAFVNRAWNKVKLPALGTLFLGILNLVIVICIAEYFKNSISVIVILTICAAFSIVQSYLLNGYCFSIIYKGHYSQLLFSGIIFGFIFVISMLASRFIQYILAIDSLLNLVISFISITLVMFLLVYSLFFNKRQKGMLKSIIK